MICLAYCTQSRHFNAVLFHLCVCVGECVGEWVIYHEYAKELVDGLDTIAFPENVKSLQRDWLGRSEGAQISFKVADSEIVIEVFTTRPDTLFG